MLSVWGYSGSDGASGVGTWHEITPQPGDTFTITDEYLEFDEDLDGKFADYGGGTMTFGDTPFTMLPYSAFPGEYVLGIGVEDFDGNAGTSRKSASPMRRLSGEGAGGGSDL